MRAAVRSKPGACDVLVRDAARAPGNRLLSGAGLDRLAQDGLQFLRRRPAGVAQVDLVVHAGRPQAVGAEIGVMELVEYRGLVVVGADVQQLRASAFVESQMP